MCTMSFKFSKPSFLTMCPRNITSFFLIPYKFLYFYFPKDFLVSLILSAKYLIKFYKTKKSYIWQKETPPPHQKKEMFGHFVIWSKKFLTCHAPKCQNLESRSGWELFSNGLHGKISSYIMCPVHSGRGRCQGSEDYIDRSLGWGGSNYTVQGSIHAGVWSTKQQFSEKNLSEKNFHLTNGILRNDSISWAKKGEP